MLDEHRKEYAAIRKVLKDQSVRFRTLFPGRLKAKYQEGDEIYDTVEEAMRDLDKTGFDITPVKQPETKRASEEMSQPTRTVVSTLM